MWMGNIDVNAMGTTEPAALAAATGALDAIRLLAGIDPEYRIPSSLARRARKAKAGKAIKLLMASPWWSRIWTVQETTSPKNATILWGPLSIPWSFMKDAAENLIQGHYPPAERLRVHDLVDEFGFFTYQILGLMFAARWVVQPHPPLEMLWRFRYRDSTDPRDKVYVILNLVAEGTYPLPSVPTSNYTLTTVVLYRRVMLDLLCNERGLRAMIGLRGERKSVPGLPSWVVDWSRPIEGFGISDFWAHSRFWLTYTANRGLPMLNLDELTSPDHGEDVLNVNGVFFDKILVCSDVITKEEEGDRLYELAAELIAKALVEKPHRVISEDYWHEALVDIIKGNYAKPEIIIEGVSSDAYWREEMLKYQQLFITENGAVGLGPSRTSIGDEVWVLSGGQSPFLLGPLHANDAAIKSQDCSYHYTFRGDVFVPAIMGGEAVESRIENQRFVHIH
ncbi:hypothetical protein E0Z10_g9870 [Xylaria hypoxylon]|uniref:Heterokaryon incompatibility domain-containing protein n=1 Tax=Xylaria hypoxylon TaxID=37992 RepID=A0A4Z0YHW6_9PEZI|nr:hypothetical protein E0Z10_g9870 [Xylaria hypoxylon]